MDRGLRCILWGVCVTGSSGAAVQSLLEREAELAQMDLVFERVGAGVGVVVVVEGPAGIGKSELLSAVSGRRAPGVWGFGGAGVGV